MTKKTQTKRRKKAVATDCTIPPPIPAAALSSLVLPRDEDEVSKICEYVEWQSKDERVIHAEKVSEE